MPRAALKTALPISLLTFYRLTLEIYINYWKWQHVKIGTKRVSHQNQQLNKFRKVTIFSFAVLLNNVTNRNAFYMYFVLINISYNMLSWHTIRQTSSTLEQTHTRCLSDVGLMLDHRLRCWPSNTPALVLVLCGSFVKIHIIFVLSERERDKSCFFVNIWKIRFVHELKKIKMQNCDGGVVNHCAAESIVSPCFILTQFPALNDEKLFIFCENTHNYRELSFLGNHASITNTFIIFGGFNSVWNTLEAVYGSSRIRVNPFKHEFTIVIFIHYKPWIAVAILDL